MKKILLVGVCDQVGSTNNDILNSLQSLGYSVDVFNYRTIESEEASFNILKKVVEKATSYLRRIPIGLFFRRWYFFFPSRYHMNKKLLLNVQNSNYDLVLFMKTDTVDWLTLRKISKIVVTWYFFMDPPEECYRIQAPLYAKYATFSSATFSTVLNQFKQKNKKSYWIIEGDIPENFEGFSSVKKDIDVVFVGSMDFKRIKVLQFLRDHNISIRWYGPGSDFSEVYGERLYALYKRSKIVLNINRKGEGFSNRVLQALFSNAFLLSEYSDDLAYFFNEGEHLDVFRSVDDCLARIRYYLENELDRNKIAECGARYAKSNFSWETQLSKMMAIIQKS